MLQHLDADLVELLPGVSVLHVADLDTRGGACVMGEGHKGSNRDQELSAS